MVAVAIVLAVLVVTSSACATEINEKLNEVGEVGAGSADAGDASGVGAGGGVGIGSEVGAGTAAGTGAETDADGVNVVDAEDCGTEGSETEEDASEKTMLSWLGVDEEMSMIACDDEAKFSGVTLIVEVAEEIEEIAEIAFAVNVEPSTPQDNFKYISFGKEFAGMSPFQAPQKMSATSSSTEAEFDSSKTP